MIDKLPPGAERRHDVHSMIILWDGSFSASRIAAFERASLLIDIIESDFWNLDKVVNIIHQK